MSKYNDLPVKEMNSFAEEHKRYIEAQDKALKDLTVSATSGSAITKDAFRDNCLGLSGDDNSINVITEFQDNLKKLTEDPQYKRALLHSESGPMTFVKNNITKIYTEAENQLEAAHKQELEAFEKNFSQIELRDASNQNVKTETYNKMKKALEARQLAEKTALVNATNTFGNQVNDFYDWEQAARRKVSASQETRVFSHLEEQSSWSNTLKQWASFGILKPAQAGSRASMNIEELKSIGFTATSHSDWSLLKPFSSLDLFSKNKIAKIKDFNVTKNADGSYTATGRIEFPAGASALQKISMAGNHFLALAAATKPDKPNEPAIKEINLNDFAHQFGLSAAKNLAIRMKGINPGITITNPPGVDRHANDYYKNNPTASRNREIAKSYHLAPLPKDPDNPTDKEYNEKCKFTTINMPKPTSVGTITPIAADPLLAGARNSVTVAPAGPNALQQPKGP